MNQELRDSIESFRNRYSLQTGETLGGFEFDYGLAGPNGCWITIWLPSNVSANSPEAKAARDEAYAKHDVVRLNYRHIPDGELEKERFVSSGSVCGWVDAARWIVDHRTARRIVPETGEMVPTDKRGGIALDLFSASAMIRVYDALSTSNRDKFAHMDLRAAHDVTFKLLEKGAV